MGQELKGIERRGFLEAVGAALGTAGGTGQAPRRPGRPGYIWVEIPAEAWKGLLQAARALEHRGPD
jgi:hypothetical protein